MKVNNLHFKKSLILFWTVWWGIALWTDIIGGIAHLGYVKATWAPDTNYPFLKTSLAMYHVPEALVGALFVGIIGWLGLSFITFAHACLALGQPKEIWMARAKRAFIISLALWLAFFISDQLIMNFDLEMNHMVQGGFQLLCYLCLFELPDN